MGKHLSDKEVLKYGNCFVGQPRKQVQFNFKICTSLDVIILGLLLV